MSDVSGRLCRLRHEGKRVMVEDAQGSRLDIAHGTLPERDLFQHHGQRRLRRCRGKISGPL